MKEIRTLKGLKELKRRYLESGFDFEKDDNEWIKVIDGCIASLKTDEPIAMDQCDYDNSPRQLKTLWKGLK